MATKLSARARAAREAFDFDPDRHQRDAAREAVEEHLRNYVKSRNGMHVWAAWRELRGHGLEPTEPILAKLDQFAQKLLEARSDREMLAALELTPGSVDASVAEAELGARMRALWRAACEVTGETPKRNVRPRVPVAVYEQVAARHNMTWRALQQQWQRWWQKPARERAASFDEVASSAFSGAASVFQRR